MANRGVSSGIFLSTQLEIPAGIWHVLVTSCQHVPPSIQRTGAVTLKRWVIADTHFGHSMLVDIGSRPAKFEDRIFEAWQRMVAPEDLIIHLGDVSLPDTVADVWVKLSNLPGRKILVMGNHDKRSAKWYMERGFAFACDSFELGGILFTHRPRLIVPEHIDFNVHGHLHNTGRHLFTPGPKHRLVALEYSNYSPVRVEKITRKSK